MVVEKGKQNLNIVKEFINHNLNIGYLKEYMTIKQLLGYIDNIENNYIPIMNQIENVASKKITEEEISIPKIIKTNKIRYREITTIEWNINGNNLNIKVEGYQINLKTFLKILIQEINQLKKFNYTRISPYRISHEYAKNREDKNHVFTVQFIDVKDNNRIKTQEIIRSNRCMAIEQGEYNFFIPDLLEVAIDRNLMTLNDNTYEYREQSFKSVTEIEYIDNRMDREILTRQGWKVPIEYK